MTDKINIWDELRKPFPKESVGKLPKAGMQLDYVGHAAVTDRLLRVDPSWTWEPLAVDPETQMPLLDDKNGLWIKLTVGGVTRIGYGDGPDNKQRIGDAIRNAAMRFGVALDLWTKDELESNIDHPENKNKPAPQVPKPAPVRTSLSGAQVVELLSIAKKQGISSKENATDYINGVLLCQDFTKLDPASFHEYKAALEASEVSVAVEIEADND